MTIGTRAWVAAVMAVAGMAVTARAVEPVAATTTTLPAETPQQHDARMAWWRDARFGMFIHFGLYSELGGEWHGEKTKGAGEWIMNALKIPRDQYAKELLPKFDPVKFDAKRIVAAAKGAGMKYIVITSKHHEGFCLFDTKHTDFNVMSTPFKRDIMKEMAAAANEAGIKICWYYSIMDWHDPRAHGATFPQYAADMRGELHELLSNYGKIGVMWFDGEWIPEWTEEQGRALYAELRAIQPDLIINNRISKARAGMEGLNKYGQAAGDYGTPEQQVPKVAPPGDWETCMTMNDTWGWKKDDHNWKSTQTLIRTLVDVASKGGNFLLNVGPTGEGEIPEASVQRLAEMGKWMDVNGQSVWGTQRSPYGPPPPWGRITAKGDKVYLHVFDWPKDRRLALPGNLSVSDARVLGAPDAKVTVSATPDGVTLELPAAAPDLIDTVIEADVLK